MTALNLAPAMPLCRFHEHWRFVLQRLVFLAAFVVYLETETLVTREAVTEILGSKCFCVICRVTYISLGFDVGGKYLSVCECVCTERVTLIWRSEDSLGVGSSSLMSVSSQY